MEIRQLEAFVVIADELHFGRAARRLHMGQPTLSDLVRRLEREAGTALLHRTTRRVSLTDAGAELRERARVILDEVDATSAAMKRWAHGETGGVVLGITPPAAPLLAPYLAEELHREAPGLDLTLRRMWLPDLKRALTDGSVDVGITCGRVDGPPGVRSEIVCGEPWVVGLRADHPLAARTSVTLSELGGATLGIQSEKLFPAWGLAQRQALRTARITPPVFELDDTDLAASRWTSQSDVDWILTTATMADPPADAVVRPVSPALLLPFTALWAPGRVRHAGVARLLRLARTGRIPAGWVRVAPTARSAG
jgi:DNA-binding transcriptional LysR family regulator